MTAARQPVDTAASARARLYNLSRQQGKEFQRILSEFAIERLLYRLGESPYRERYILKGATLFRLWKEGVHRATWDVDLLGRGANSVTDVVAVFRDLCGAEAADAIVFDPASVRGEVMSAMDEYTGVRVIFEARLAEARIPVQVDIGFGDAIPSGPSWETFPTLLDYPAPRILVYPREAVVAEKLEAMLAIGITNSRMKDFYDVYLLASLFPFEGGRLSESIAATLRRRGTPIPDGVPLVMTSKFLTDPARQVQWKAFLRRSRLEASPESAELASALQNFFVPVLDALAKGQTFHRLWPAGGPWC